MSKRRNILYWIATVWLSLGMVSTAIVQLAGLAEEVQKTVRELGYPSYFLYIIGVWKLLGVAAVLLPRLPLLKEWAYAGFFFAMSGAVISHLAVYDPLTELFGPVLLLVLTVVSWYLRPVSRKITPGIKNYEQ